MIDGSLPFQKKDAESGEIRTGVMAEFQEKGVQWFDELCGVIDDDECGFLPTPVGDILLVQESAKFLLSEKAGVPVIGGLGFKACYEFDSEARLARAGTADKCADSDGAIGVEEFP